jgi:hypothetical protein
LEQAVRFEGAVECLFSSHDEKLRELRDRYMEYRRELVRKINRETDFESLFLASPRPTTPFLGSICGKSGIMPIRLRSLAKSTTMGNTSTSTSMGVVWRQFEVWLD